MYIYVRSVKKMEWKDTRVEIIKFLPSVFPQAYGEFFFRQICRHFFIYNLICIRVGLDF